MRVNANGREISSKQEINTMSRERKISEQRE